ncbi:MAG: phytanoyl-CoA dioxygenase family protein [Hormoscilla sp.]
MLYQNYDTTLDGVTNSLEKYGLAVIPNVLNAEEIEAMQKGMWEMLEYISQDFELPIKQANPQSWKGIYQLFPSHSMLFQHFSLSHSQHVWDLRQNEKVVEVFANIWQCPQEQPLTSFDGLSVHLPPEITGRGWYRGNDWLHVDQSYTRNNFECVQGFITAWDIEEGDASLTFLEKSHHKHEDFRDVFEIDNKEAWYKLNETEYDYYIKQACERKSLKCSAGSMVLWDSRLVHAGMEPVKGRKHPKIRHVVYICQMPKKLCSEAMLRTRIRAFEELRTTNHYPHKVRLFPKQPRTYGKALPPIKQIPRPRLSELGKKLVGY